MAIAEAQAKAKKIAEAQARAAAEEVAKAIAKEQAAHAAMAAAEVAKAIAEAEDWFWIPEAKEPEAMVPDAITPVAREPRVLLSDAGTYEPKAMPPVAGESEAVLPESQEPKAMPPVAGENEAMLPDSREHKAMSPIAGKTQAMSPVVKPKPLPDGLVLSCKTPPQPVTAPPQSSNLEKVKLSSPTLLIEQEPGEPPGMLIFSNKLPLQPAKHGQPQPQRGRGVGHRRLCLRRRQLQTMVQHWRCQSHRKRMNTCTVNAMWATSSPMSAPLRPCGRPFRHHLHHHRRRDKLIAGMGTTSSPKSRSLMPYGWFFHQHLHRQAGNGSLPPSAPKTPPTYAQKMSHTRNGSLPPSAPKTPPKTSCTGNGSLPPSAPKTPPTYTQMTASTESDRSQTTDSNISKTVPEKLDKQSSVNSMLLYIVLYYSVHSVIVLFDHHGSGGSCVASGDYISAAQLMLIAHSLSRPVLV